MLRFTSGIFVYAVLLLSAGPLAADTLTLRNGDRLTGEVVLLKDGVLSFRTGYADLLKIAAGEIAGLETDGLVTVRYDGGGYSTGRLSSAKDGTVTVAGARGGSPRVAVEDISEIHPGSEIPRGFRWSGRANFGATQRSGNTDTRSVHVDAAIRGRAEKDRLRLEGSMNKEFDRSKRTQDDFSLFAQHDRFVSKALYLYTNVKFAGDDLQDLNLRTSIGTGAGWQVVESKRTNLSLEAGPTYVNENFETGTDRDYVAGRWAVIFDRYVWEEIAQFFHKHEGTVDLEQAGNVLIDSSTGVRFPLSDGFNFTIQADVDWDSEPEPGVSSTDKTYLLTAGYSW